jgi:hypothetical protein
MHVELEAVSTKGNAMIEGFYGVFRTERRAAAMRIHQSHCASS